MKSGKIVIASVLKPIDDTRLFEKLGLSLSKNNKYDVNIIGFNSKKSISHPKISFYPLFDFQRSSYKRLLASWKYYNLLLKVKPHLVIVSSPELLPVTLLYKILFGAKISYDVQENYYANIRYTPTYPKALRRLLANLVRGLERISRPLIDVFLLAEKCYVYELPFTKGKSVVIQNKFRPLGAIRQANSLSKLPLIRLLYSGTISYNYGIMEAIELANNISKLHRDIQLKIIGFAADPELHKKLKVLSEQNANIIYLGEERPIPHKTILNAIPEADFALLPYQPDKSIENCFPTKIWEYMAHKLPMIIQNHKPWADYCHQHNASIAINFKDYDTNEVLGRLISSKFYSFKEETDIFWQSEELTLLKAIEHL